MRRRLRRGAWGAAALSGALAGGLVLAGAPPAAAHGLGSRGDLPLPLWMFAYGAAAAILISFAGLSAFWRTAGLEDGGEGRTLVNPGRVTTALAVVLRAAGLAVFIVLTVAASFGDTDSSDNIAPVLVYVVFWVGMILVSAPVGDVWRVLSPFDTRAAIGQRLARRHRQVGAATPDADGEDGPHRYRLGRWSAVAGLAGFVWLELIYPYRAEPRTLAVAVALYTAAVLAATARWGRGWLRNGEASTALFGLLAQMAPLSSDGDGRIRLRAPLRGLAHLRPDAPTQALIILALGSTSYDGLSRTGLWAEMTRDYGTLENVLIGTLGLIWTTLVVVLVYAGAMRVTARWQARDHSELGAAFAHSLVPIAFAYVLAHYFSLVVFEGQNALALASDPFGRGWDLFGTAGRAVDFAAVSTTTIAYIQASGIVAGHVAGVVMAHDRALALFHPPDATRSQYPLLAAMVLFTVGGLALLLGA